MANFKKRYQVFLSKHDLLFLMVTKTASTSIKHFFFHVENGFPFKGFKVNGGEFDIHDVYGTTDFKDIPTRYKRANNRYALVRDPLARLVSCYKNKILKLDELSSIDPDILKQKNLKPQPNFDEFVERLDEYQDISSIIRAHSLPLVFFLGEDASWFTRVFDFSEIKEMGDTLKHITGAKNDFPAFNMSEKDTTKGVLKLYNKVNNKLMYLLGKEEISDATIAKVKKIYAKDYEVFGHIFKTDSV